MLQPKLLSKREPTTNSFNLESRPFYIVCSNNFDQEYRFEEIRKRLIESYINNQYQRLTELELVKLELGKLRKELDQIKKETERAIVFEFRNINDTFARNELIDYMKTQKKEGRNEGSIFELSQKLRLPADQVEKILYDLQKEKKIELS